MNSKRLAWVVTLILSIHLLGIGGVTSGGTANVQPSETEMAADLQPSGAEMTANVQPSDADVRDLDGDGDPDVVEFRTNFSENGQTDVVLAVDRGDNMQYADDPREMIDYDDDMLIYDRGNDGTAEIVVLFSHRLQEYPWRAAIYDQRNEVLDYEFTARTVNVPALGRLSPTVTMATQRPWIQNGNVSYALQMTCLENVRCSFDGEKFSEEGNETNVDIDVVDADRDGTPEYELRQIRSSSGLGESRHRSELMVNTGTEAVLTPDDGIVWPYVGTSSNRSYTKPTEDAGPPVLVDWENGTISAVSEFVASRADEDNYFIYSFEYLTESGLNRPSFEYPFAFYDLADDADGVPELQTRIEAYHQGSHSGLRLNPFRLPFDLSHVRYSWDQTNDGRWNYKLGLVGTNGYTNDVEVGPYRLRMPRHDRTPEWVRQHRWRGASFVAVPDGARTSEGIYVGDFDTDSRRSVLGLDPYDPPVLDRPPEGYRLEVNGRYDDRPRLFYSPVDGTVHLHDFKHGYWNRTDRPDVQYRNVDDDPYVDWWTANRTADDAHLIAESGHLVYADGDSLSFKTTDVTHSAFVTQPPTTTAEWESLRERLPDSSAKPFELDATFRGYGGSAVTIPDVTLTDYVPSENGFHVLATVPPSVSSLEDRLPPSVNSSVNLETQRSSPTEVAFVFSEGDGLQRVVRATRARLAIANASVAGNANASVAENEIEPLEQNTITVEVRNDGWQTAENVSVELVEGNSTAVTDTVRVTGHGTTRATLRWWPTPPVEDARVVVRSEDTETLRAPLPVATSRFDAPSRLERYLVGNRSGVLTLGMGLAALGGLALVGHRVIR